MLICKDASCQQTQQHKQCQKGKNGVQKNVFNYGFYSSLAIKPSHGLVQVKSENQNKDTCTGSFENAVNYKAKDEQDK